MSSSSSNAPVGHARSHPTQDMWLRSQPPPPPPQQQCFSTQPDLMAAGGSCPHAAAACRVVELPMYTTTPRRAKDLCFVGGRSMPECPSRAQWGPWRTHPQVCIGHAQKVRVCNNSRGCGWRCACVGHAQPGLAHGSTAPTAPRPKQIYCTLPELLLLLVFTRLPPAVSPKTDPHCRGAGKWQKVYLVYLSGGLWAAACGERAVEGRGVLRPPLPASRLRRFHRPLPAPLGPLLFRSSTAQAAGSHGRTAAAALRRQTHCPDTRARKFIVVVRRLVWGAMSRPRPCRVSCGEPGPATAVGSPYQKSRILPPHCSWPWQWVAN